MKYYENYINYYINASNILEATIFCENYTDNNIYAISDIGNLKFTSVIDVNRALNNDKVLIDINERNIQVIKIIKYFNFNYLDGILLINSKIIYGKNKKNIPIYLFKPNNNKYPNFLVASKIKEKFKLINSNIYCTIKYNKWDIDSKYPSGIIDTVIGPVGDMESELNYILYKNNLYKKKLKELNIKDNSIEYIKDNSIVNRQDFTNKIIFSIDPPGCKDIDDAFHIDSTKDGFQIGVHIADVSNFITDDEDYLFHDRTSTIYAPHKIINMLPEKYSNDLFSLIENTDKYAFSIIYNFDKDYNLIDYYFSKTVINVNDNMTYEYAQNIINDKSESEIYSWRLKELSNISNKINIVNKSDEEDYDSHYLVETFMVLTNNKVAEYLYSKNPLLTILRVHENNNTNNNFDIINKKKKNFINYLKIIQSQSANYCTGNSINCDNIAHYGLNIKYYTHFTSPIRRYIDILVHRFLYYLLNDTVNEDKSLYINLNEKLIKFCDNANSFNKNIKRMKRDYDKLSLINILKNNGNEIQTYCNIINIKENGIIDIYINDYNIGHRFKLFSYKLDEIVKIKNTNEKITIENIQNNKKIILHLYQDIYISINSIILEDNLNNKIKIKFLEPDISEILI